MRQLILFLSATLVACHATMQQPEADPAPENAQVAMPARAEAGEFALAGYSVYADEGRLWVFQSDSDAHKGFLAKGEPAKRVTLVGAGPDGKTLYGSDSAAMKAYAAAWKYRTPGYTVIPAGDRLWVFRSGGAGLREFQAKGEPAKRVTLVGAGPDGKTLYGSDRDDLRDFANAWKYRSPGFVVLGSEGRLWVFREKSAAFAEYLAKGEPAKRVTRVGAGPDGLTVCGADESAVSDYCAPFEHAQTGFAVIAEEGRLWIFKAGSEEHRTFLKMGEPAKCVTLVGAGPDGRTLRGSDREILDDYLAKYRYGQPGFVVLGQEGRLWVFKAGSEAYQAFLDHGEPAKRVTLVGAGPDGKTLLGAEKSTLDEYIRGGGNP